MDTIKIEEIFKEWQKKNLLTKKGALRADPKFVRCLRLCFSLFLIIALISLISVILFQLTIFLADAAAEEGLYGIILMIHLLLWPLWYYLLFSKSDKLTHICESAFFALTDPLLLPYLRANPILLFHKDHVMASSGWIGKKNTLYYTDLKSVKYPLPKKKEIRIQLRFKGMDKPFVVEKKPAIDQVMHLFGSAFQPIFCNEPLCEDMLRLYADMITLGNDPQSQQDGLQCAMKYFSEPKYKDYDYTRRLTELVDTFNHYRAQKRMPKSEDYINRCLSILKNKGVDYDGRLALLSHLFECAYASEEMVDVVELDRLSHIAFYFRIKEWDFLSLKYSFEAMKQQRGRRNGTENAQQRERYQSAYSNRLKEAYKILGLSEKATLEEVKSAYRTQVKNCHPDTLPPTAKDSEREEASIRFRTITEAYDFLCAELCAEPVSVAK
jgi:DnaJ-domain-containing protein 1